MIELHTLASFKLSKREILKNTKSLFMMESNILANIEAIKQLQKEVLEDTKSLCMMESNTLANITAIKLAKKGNLKGHQKSVHDGVKYPCTHCSYQATQKANVKEHQSLFTMESNILESNAA